jgi:hypothetical protein
MAEGLESTQTIRYSQSEYENQKFSKDGEKFLDDFKKNHPNAQNPVLTYEVISRTPETAQNPLKDAPPKSAFMLKSKKPEYYIRFGYLLDYIKENILPRVKIGEDHAANPPIFKIDSNQWNNYMYSLPNQISLDPRVCIVRNSNFTSGKGTVKVFHELWIFKPIDGAKAKNHNVAYPMNIYLNFNFVLESLQLDDKGDVNLFEFLSNICTGLNKALGGINNLEPTIDESSNTLKIIDTTPIPGLSENEPKTPYMLQLYGYDKIGSNYISNFIRKVDLKTAITPEYATMITVGATAGGYVKGTEATAFSKWNDGLRDRFKEEFTPGNIDSVQPKGGLDEAEVNYVEKFIGGEFSYFNRYGFSSFNPNTFSLVDDIIEGNISVVTEYYKYLLSKEKATSGGTIGFIPFKLSFSMDGLSGIKIYNKLNVNTGFLPKAYGKNMDLIVTGVSHKLSNNDWETDLETTVIPKSGELSVAPITPSAIQESIDNVKLVSKPSNWPYYSTTDAVPPEIAPPSKNTPPNYNSSVSFSAAVKTKYYPELLKIKGRTKGIKMLALVMTQKEGFSEGTRSYRTNNPGNIGNTDSGNNSSFPTLKSGIEKQLDYLYGVAVGTNKNYPVGKIKDIKPYYSPEIAKSPKTYKLTPYLPGYKFTYTGTLEQFVKIYSTGARAGNSYLSIIISFFRKNGFNNVTEKTTLSELIKLNNPSNIIL